MKFLYEYQDKSNKRHKGALNASDRAAAYAALREQGIKPIRCDEAPASSTDFSAGASAGSR